MWKKNVRISKRIKGEAYIRFQGIVVPGQPLLPVPCSDKGKYTCSSLLNEEHRVAIYRHPSLSAVNWFQKNRALSETALTELHRKVSVQKLKPGT
jgi:hypothetical protein